MLKYLFALLALALPSFAANVGFQITTYNSVLAAIWYPTDSLETPYTYASSVIGSVAPRAPFASGQHPLIIFSHGYSGCAIQSVFITESLARQGYIVAAPNHRDAGCDIYGGRGHLPPAPQKSFSFPWTWTDATYADRKADIENVINALVTNPAVDPARIAITGHSLGGYTALGMVGGWPSWKDSRIKAAITFSPYVEPFNIQGTLDTLGVPVMYQGSDNDSADTYYISKSGGSYDQTEPPKFFLELLNADHYIWTNSTCPSISTPVCVATVPNAAFIIQYSTALDEAYLNATDEPILFPTSLPSGLVDYRHQP